MVAHQWFRNTNITAHQPAVITGNSLLVTDVYINPVEKESFLSRHHYIITIAELSPEACDFLRNLAANASDRRATAALSEATATTTTTIAVTAEALTISKAAPSASTSSPPLMVTTSKSTQQLYPSSPSTTPTNPVTASAAAALVSDSGLFNLAAPNQVSQSNLTALSQRVSDSKLFKTTSNISINGTVNGQGIINYAVNGMISSHGGTPTPTPSSGRNSVNGGNGHHHKRGLGQLYPAADTVTDLCGSVDKSDRQMSWLDLQNSLALIESVSRGRRQFVCVAYFSQPMKANPLTLFYLYVWLFLAEGASPLV